MWYKSVNKKWKIGDTGKNMRYYIETLIEKIN